jgi:hypothetical protein
MSTREDVETRTELRRIQTELRTAQTEMRAILNTCNR